MYAMFKVQSAYSGWRRHNGSTRCWDCPAWVVTWSLLSLVGSFLFLFCLLSDLCCLLKCDEPGFWICFFLLFSACLPLVRTLYGWSRVYFIFPHLFIFFCSWAVWPLYPLGIVGAGAVRAICLLLKNSALFPALIRHYNLIRRWFFNIHSKKIS